MGDHGHAQRVTRAMTIWAVIATLVLAACGGSGTSAAQQVRTVVNDFTVDIGQGKATAACGLTTGQLRSLCNQGGVQDAINQLGSFTSLTISKVVVQGSNATVAFNGSSEVMTLAQRNGHWLVATA